jgi:Copper type II ascorbate-dependent monooxygenase, C-terminal domain/Copper type II ascorbate-dependent monooxygenase, N-terminal domain
MVTAMSARILIALVLFSLCGCSDGGADPAQPSAPAGTTWYRDVLPIAQEHCLGCHNDEAPTFSMARFDAELAARAPLIAQLTAIGTMPPWKPSTDCNSYHGERVLDEAAIAVFADWAADGAAEGDPAHAPAPLDAAPGLPSIDRIVGMVDDYTPEPPAGDVNDHRCFVMDPELEENAILRGFDVRPGERAVVHHVLLYTASAAELTALDAADPGLGYACSGGPGASSARVIAGWVPGMPANLYPSDTGVPLNSDELMVMQIHYNTAQSGPLPDRTEVDLHLADMTVDSPALIMSVSDPAFAIPPQTEAFTTTVEVEVPATATLWAAAPHMHLMGRQTRVEIERPNGDNTCLVDIPDWDFDWQQFYFLADPKGLPVEAGDTLRFSCTWDNSSSDTVTWGDDTEDEMCITYLYATPGHVE